MFLYKCIVPTKRQTRSLQEHSTKYVHNSISPVSLGYQLMV